MSLKTVATLLATVAMIAACRSAPPPVPAETPPVGAVADSRPAPAAPEPARAPTVTAGMTASVSGKVSYRVRKTLPPEAVIKVQLLDATRADETARVLGEQTIETKGRQVPIAYRVAYDPTAILAKNRYQVTATITVDKDVWFITDPAARVITGGNPKRRDIVVKRAKPS